MTIRLNCLACGHPMDISDAYDDYAGAVRCWGCRAVLEVTLEDGKLKAMRRSGGVGAPPLPAERAELSESLSPAGLPSTSATRERN